MNRIFLLVLFTFSYSAGYSQKNSSLLLDANSILPFQDNLRIQNLSITKFQDTKQKQFSNTDLLLRDSAQNTLNYNFSKSAKVFDGNIVIDNFKTTKFKKNPKTTIVKRDLLFRDTDKKVQLIYPSRSKLNIGN